VRLVFELGRIVLLDGWCNFVLRLVVNPFRGSFVQFRAKSLYLDILGPGARKGGRWAANVGYIHTEWSA
jgi:hypothetical protein